MKRTRYYAVAAIANALASVPSRIYQYTTGCRLASRLRVVARRRFRPAVFLIVLASLFVSSAPSAPNSVARLTTHSGMSATLRDTASQVAGNLYQSLRYRYASSVSSLPSINWRANRPASNLLTPMPLPVLGPPTGVGVTSVSSASISLSWSSPGGAVHHYQVERSQSAQGPFMVIANPVVTSHQDNTVSNGAAYLYRVRAVDSLGAASSPSTIAVGTAINFEDPTLTAGTTPIKKQHIYDLRQSVSAVRALAGLSGFSWTNADLTGALVQAIHVQELRTKLDDALLALNVPVTAYSDPVLATGANGTPIRKIHIEELRLRSTDNSSTSTGSISASSESAQARLDPANETGGGGENPLSRNYNLNIPLLGLPGRAGLDLGLSLSYNSLVWTKHGSSISFDDDAGFPSAGFRLGFPVIQPLYFNSQVGKNAFLLIGSDGSRTELRQVNTSALYEAADSSYLLLDSNDLNTMTLRTADGTQLTYVGNGSDYQCTKIKDRNGNFITINYTAFGRISTVVDTLERVITFNYDATNHLMSITQQWSGQNHVWAKFDYSPAVQILTNFPGLTVVAPSTVKALYKVTFNDDSVTPNDDSRIEFDYTSYGQIWRVKNFAADGHQLNYRAYNLPEDVQTPQTDCPRFTTRVDWAENFNRSGPNGTSGLPSGTEQEVSTSWIVPTSTSWTMPDGSNQSGTLAQVTAADGTYNKIYFEGTAGTSNGWKRGLASLVETYDSGNVRQRQSVTAWTQDDTGVSFPVNPRVTETNVYDPAGNRARTTVSYQTITVGDGTSCKLPADVIEFQANATTPLRRNHSDYNTDSAYLSRRIIGLVSEKTLFQVDPNTLAETLMSKVGFSYDDTGSIQGTDTPVQHDNTNYTASFVTGRANLSTIKRFDANNASVFTSSTMKYNPAGAAVTTIDPMGHATSVSYADNFSDGINNRNTLAYPTTVTDPDAFSSTATYNFDFGSVTRTQAPPPAGQSVGAIKNFIYDSKARLEKTAIEFNGNADYSHTRFVYPNSQNRIDTYVTIQEGTEAHSFTILDGHGRTFASVADHPGSSGGFSAKLVLFNNLGRAIKSSNPTETSASGAPTQWVATGDDASAGWLYTQQTYDWKGRPLVTTNPSITGNPNDTTTKEVSYTGCGCAGGEVVTLTDEGTMDAGVFKRRQKKIYSDVLGRTVKTENLSWQGGSPYSTTVNSYNARNQVTQASQYQGGEFSGVYQETTMTYDGYGRLQSKHVPEQETGTATLYTYNADDTFQSVTDARGASATYGYNNRHLVTGITYAVPQGSNIPATPNVTFAYDAGGNRTSMTDGLGVQSYSYDTLSRMTSETRTFNGVGTFTLAYDYNLAGELKKITDATGMTINYGFDSAGRLNSVTGADNLFMGVSNYGSNFQYRAWGGLKAVTDGANRTSSWLYNSRLQPSHYEVSGNIVSQSYDYYNDGRTSFVHNLTDSNFDRSYAYDHVARVNQATTGGQARGDSGATPYNEGFGYDVFNNLNSRSTVSWGVDEMSDGGSYTNNRRSDWGYDANGNNTMIGSRTYQFDAAGQMTLMTGQQWLVTHYITVTQASAYDGQGRKLEEVTFGQATYYLRSSVVNDAIIEELDSSGQKKVGYVYSPAGELLAKQVTGQSGYLAWKYGSPADTSEYEAQHNSSSVTRTELDPLGANVPLEYTPPPEVQNAGDLGAGQVGGMFDSRWSNFFDVSSGCSAQGVAASCHDNASAMNNLGVMRPNLIQVTINITYRNGDRRTMQFVTTSNVINSGFNHTFTGGAAVAAAGAWNAGLSGGLDNALIGSIFAGFATEAAQRRYAHAPQNTGIQIVPLGNLQKGLENILKGDCGVFVQKLIDMANSLFGNGKPHATSFWDAFGRIQDAGGYQLDNVASNGGTVGGDLFFGEFSNPALPENPSAGPGTVHMTPYRTIGRSARPAEAALAQARYVYMALHETLHLAKLGHYSDEQLARAGHKVDGTTAPKYEKDDVLSWSGNFDTVLQKHCAYPFK